MAHKRPGRKAREARIRRARKRSTIIVHFPKRWDPERVDGVSPGHCVAWADGRRIGCR